MSKITGIPKLSRTFTCPKCLQMHKVTSDRPDLDTKQDVRIKACKRKQKGDV